MSALALRIRQVIEAFLCLALFSMVALTFVDVIGRRLFDHPVFGAYDITEHQMAFIVFCGLPLVTAVGGHLTVDLFDGIVDSPHMRWWRVVTETIMVIVFLVIGYMFFREASSAVAISAVSEELLIPRAPLYVFMGVSAIMSAVAVLVASRGRQRMAEGAVEDDL